jgi:hypothetical protein
LQDSALRIQAQRELAFRDKHHLFLAFARNKKN